MFGETLAVLPPWLVAGVALGAVASVVVAGLFVAGERVFPTASSSGYRVDGNARRRSEIRGYLRTIGESYVEDREVHGTAVAFYLPERDVAITFDAQSYFRLTETATHTILFEEEMPGTHLGRRLPFEVEDAPSAPDAASDPVAAAFDRLGLDVDADPEAVRDAYREQVKEVHPDQGGSEAAFARVREAYATASNHAEADG